MDSRLVLRSYRVILNQWTKWKNRSGWLPKTSFDGRLPNRWEICDVSKMGVTFYGVCPPIFIKTQLQQYNRDAFFYSSHCFFRNTIGLRLMCRRNDSRKDLHKLCRIPKNCQCKWLLVSSRVPGTSANFFGSCEVLFLHRCAWIHWVARSCTTTAYRWLFRDSQLSLRTLWSTVVKSQKFTARGAGLCLLHGALYFWSVYKSRNFGLQGNVYKTLCSPKSSRLFIQRGFMRWTGVRTSLSWNFIIHQISLNSCSLRDLKIQRVASFCRGLFCICFWDFVDLDSLRFPWPVINQIGHWPLERCQWQVHLPFLEPTFRLLWCGP